MSVENTTTKVEATGNGSATVFSFSPIVLFEPRSADGGTHDLEVTLVTIATEAETVLSEGTGSSNYSVSVASYPGTGSITYPATGGSPIASTHKLVIKRKLRLKQYEDLNNQGGYFADTQEEMHDRHRMVDLQQQEELDRAVKVPIGRKTHPADLLAEIEADAATASAAATTATTQAGIATTQAGIATAAAANLPNATTAGANKYIKSNSGGTGWDYSSSIVGTDVDAATASARGSVELATPAEAQTGTDTARAVTPEGLKATVSQIPINSQNGAGYTAVLADAGKAIMKAAADTSARTYTIPANASVAYEIGACLTFINEAASGNVTIAITSDTLVLSPAGTTGSRTLAPNGMATAIKVTATKWLISGTGLT